MAEAPIKIKRETHRRIKINAAIDGITMAEFVDRAVEQFLENHKKEIEVGLEYARKVLVV